MNATATGSSISLCKLFGNKAFVNQDGVPWTNYLVATPNTHDNGECPDKLGHNKSTKFMFRRNIYRSIFLVQN